MRLKLTKNKNWLLRGEVQERTEWEKRKVRKKGGVNPQLGKFRTRGTSKFTKQGQLQWNTLCSMYEIRGPKKRKVASKQV